MPIYLFACPICRKQYKLTLNDPSVLVQKTFSCPNCQYSAPFGTLIKGLPAPVTHTEKSFPMSESQKTHSATKLSVNNSTQFKAYLSIVGSNSKFILSQGLYILGRKSSDSSATLQLAPDISMSRQHARLAVQVVNGKLMAQIVGLKANNPVYINGKMCQAGRPHTLVSGDILQLGMTKLVYSI